MIREEREMRRMMDKNSAIKLGLGSALGFAALALAGCGDGGNGQSSGSGSGTVSEEWRDFCTATFTEDHMVTNVYGDPKFLARAGEEYLLSAYGQDFSSGSAKLIYLAAGGPNELQIEASDGEQDFPFTSQCQFGSVVPYYAVFADVSVYAEDSLDTKICDLQRGQALPTEDGKTAGFVAQSFNHSGPMTYEVYLNAFAAQCGGAELGYISVPQTRVFDTTTWLVPIRTVVGPQE